MTERKSVKAPDRLSFQSTNMKILTLLALAALASCAPKLPRAIITPPTTVDAVDSGAVVSASTEVADGTERVIEANRKAREANNKAVDTSVRLRAAIDRAAALADGQELLRQAWDEAERFALQLSEDLDATQSALTESQIETDSLRTSVKSLSSKVSILTASAAANAVQSAAVMRENATLREQAIAGNESRDGLLTAKADIALAAVKKHRWKLIVLVSALLIFIFRKPLMWLIRKAFGLP